MRRTFQKNITNACATAITVAAIASQLRGYGCHTSSIRRLSLFSPNAIGNSPKSLKGTSTWISRRFQSSSYQHNSPSPIVHITQKNIKTEFEESTVPILLYFHITNNPDVVEYTNTVIHQVKEANRKHYTSGIETPTTGPDRGIVIKLCLIDCQREQLLAERFSINAHQFPLIVFARKKEFLDRMVGVVSEAQVKEAVDAFVDYTVKVVKEEADGKKDSEIKAKIQRADNDDENAMTLLQVAHQKLRVKEIPKATELYSKALKLSTEATQRLKDNIGWDKKKQTDDMWNRLRRDGNYNAMAQSMAGLSMCEMANRNYAEGLRMVSRIREEFPFATKDLKDVTEAIVRIELVFVSNFDLDKDNYVSLLKFENLESDPVEFYLRHVKIAVAHVLDKKHRAGIIELVKLIRVEPKLLPALKAAKVVEPDCTLSANVSTPARRAVFLIFEVLGPHHETTVEGRKMLEPYL